MWPEEEQPTQALRSGGGCTGCRTGAMRGSGGPGGHVRGPLCLSLGGEGTQGRSQVWVVEWGAGRCGSQTPDPREQLVPPSRQALPQPDALPADVRCPAGCLCSLCP